MVNWLYKKGIQGAEVLAANTDAQHLTITEADKKIIIGKDLTRGLGCGGFPNKGAEAARESMQSLKDVLKDADMVFVCAGMGGGTGTGSASVVGQVAKDLGALAIAVVTKPFGFEGRRRADVAEQGITRLMKSVDTVVAIPNDRLEDSFPFILKKGNS
jgi:cell division protein FtsZ